MKRKITLASILALVGLTAGCANSQSVQPTISKTTVITEKQSSQNENTENNGSSIIMNMYNTFKDEGKNWAFSPYSLNDCFSLVYPAANGETEQELDKVIDFTNRGVDFYRNYDESLVFDGTHGVKVSNNAYVNKVREEQLNPDVLGGKVTFVDMTTPVETVGLINTQVSEDTNNKINNLLSSDSINDNTEAVLVNALYFNMTWDYQEDELFWKNEKWVESFKGGFSLQEVKESGDIDILKLPYDTLEGGNQYSMYIICDNVDSEEANVDAFMNELTAEELDELLNFDGYTGLKGYDETGGFKVPSFRIEYKSSMMNGLRDLGLSVSISDNADFLKSGVPMKISDVIQAVYVDVNHKGTEAAAATAMMMDTCSASIETKPKKIKYVRADDTFTFIIKDDSANNILFMGRVDQLEAKED